jgi:hypothetical protein
MRRRRSSRLRQSSLAIAAQRPIAVGGIPSPPVVRRSWFTLVRRCLRAEFGQADPPDVRGEVLGRTASTRDPPRRPTAKGHGWAHGGPTCTNYRKWSGFIASGTAAGGSPGGRGCSRRSRHSRTRSCACARRSSVRTAASAKNSSTSTGSAASSSDRGLLQPRAGVNRKHARLKRLPASIERPSPQNTRAPQPSRLLIGERDYVTTLLFVGASTLGVHDPGHVRSEVTRLRHKRRIAHPIAPPAATVTGQSHENSEPSIGKSDPTTSHGLAAPSAMPMQSNKQETARGRVSARLRTIIPNANATPTATPAITRSRGTTKRMRIPGLVGVVTVCSRPISQLLHAA